jgi:hypothetical protein
MTGQLQKQRSGARGLEHEVGCAAAQRMRKDRLSTSLRIRGVMARASHAVKGVVGRRKGSEGSPKQHTKFWPACKGPRWGGRERGVYLGRGGGPARGGHSGFEERFEEDWEMSCYRFSHTGGGGGGGNARSRKPSGTGRPIGQLGCLVVRRLWLGCRRRGHSGGGAS